MTLFVCCNGLLNTQVLHVNSIGMTQLLYFHLTPTYFLLRGLHKIPSTCWLATPHFISKLDKVEQKYITLYPQSFAWACPKAESARSSQKLSSEEKIVIAIRWLGSDKSSSACPMRQSVRRVARMYINNLYGTHYLPI